MHIVTDQKYVQIIIKSGMRTFNGYSCVQVYLQDY